MYHNKIKRLRHEKTEEKKTFFLWFYASITASCFIVVIMQKKRKMNEEGDFSFYRDGITHAQFFILKDINNNKSSSGSVRSVIKNNLNVFLSLKEKQRNILDGSITSR